MVDHAFGGVFDGNASVVGASGFDFMEDVADAELGNVVDGVSEFHFRSLMRKGRFGTEECDFEGTFETERAGHDFAVDGAERGIRHGAFIKGFQFFEERLFPFGDIKGLSALPFPLPDFLDDFVAVVEQTDDLPVDRVDLHSQILNIHIIILVKVRECEIYSHFRRKSSGGSTFSGKLPQKILRVSLFFSFFCVLPIDNFAGLVYNVAKECLMVCLELSRG